MKDVTEILNTINIPEIVLIIFILWVFYKRIDRRFDAVDRRLEKMEVKDAEMAKQINEIDKRVFGIETMMHMKDCCMLKDDRIKKVE